VTLPTFGYVHYRQEHGVRVLQLDGWPGHLARRALNDKLGAITTRAASGHRRTNDRKERRVIERSLDDIDASYRALLRFELERCSDARDLCRLQADENMLSALPLGTISPELLLATYQKFPGWFPGEGGQPGPFRPSRDPRLT
jgi:hypothetical protein